MVARWCGQPRPYHAIELIPVSVRMLAVHPLAVQPDTEFVHVQGCLDTHSLGRRLSWCTVCFRPVLGRYRPGVRRHVHPRSPDMGLSWVSEERGHLKANMS